MFKLNVGIQPETFRNKLLCSEGLVVKLCKNRITVPTPVPRAYIHRNPLKSMLNTLPDNLREVVQGLGFRDHDISC